MTGRRKCSELGGLFHSMPLTTICGTIGALAISSFPLTSGFVSKSMITQAATDGQLLAVWLLLAAASAGVFLHAGIKFPWFVFFQKDSGLRPPNPPATMRWAMVLFAFLCIALGVWPEPLYRMLPYPVDYVPYTAAHVLTQLQLLLFSGLAFFLLLPMAQAHADDHAGHRLGLSTPAAGMRAGAMDACSTAWARSWPVPPVHSTDCVDAGRHRPDPGRQGVLARTWPIRSMALWVLVCCWWPIFVLYYVELDDLRPRLLARPTP